MSFRAAMPHRLARLAMVPFVLVALATAGQSRASTKVPAAIAQDAWDLCARQAARAETEQDLPPHLLGAISKVESGRWNGAEQAVFAWPWTVMAEGKGRFLPTKAAAIAEVEALRARGLRNIDVGCMQVNLLHHPDAFGNLADAFDPAHNVDYAARLLRDLRHEARSWTKAIAHYHSRTPAFNGPYRLKVFRAWRAERHRANRDRRAALAAVPADSPR